MKIAIAGYGVEGEQNYQYFNTPDNDVVIVDEKDVPSRPLPVDAMTILGEGAFSKLEGFDLVVRTAGLAPNKIHTDGKIWSATNEFFEKCPAPIIGVTGTKGKGTTSSLIASILCAAGKTVHLVGNIGTPGLTVLSNIQPDDIVVYELSSFQLWDAERSPHIAVVLGVEPDHLDVHSGMDDYVAAKTNIVLHQSANDVTVFNENNEIARSIAGKSVAQKLAYPVDIAHLADALVLPGKHNVENASAAVLAVREYVQDEDSIRIGLEAFKGLPHRLKFIREVNNVKFYDDSIATTPGSVIAAIAAFEAPKVLLLGGSDKGADYTELVELCERTGTKVVAVGQTGAAIAELCAQIGVVCERGGATMAEIVDQANELAQPGDVVILSPAAASFDMFKSYADRGDQFIAAVNSL